MPKIKDHGFNKLYLVHHEFSDEFYKGLAEVMTWLLQLLQKNTEIEELIISSCGLTSGRLAKFCGELSECQNLGVLDLSCNKLDYCCGSMIGKIISSHGEKKNEAVWLHGLRNESPPSDLHKKGLCELNLERNFLDDTAAEDICKFLNYDKWLRSLNLRNNKLELKGCLDFVKLLSKNETLLSLDLRENPGFNRKLSHIVLEKLSNNMESFKKNLAAQERGDSPEAPSDSKGEMSSPEKSNIVFSKNTPTKKRSVLDLNKKNSSLALVTINEDKMSTLEEMKEKESPIDPPNSQKALNSKGGQNPIFKPSFSRQKPTLDRKSRPDLSREERQNRKNQAN
jgi:hypothetical protein